MIVNYTFEKMRAINGNSAAVDRKDPPSTGPNVIKIIKASKVAKSE